MPVETFDRAKISLGFDGVLRRAGRASAAGTMDFSLVSRTSKRLKASTNLA
jgi:hypothetical protein